MQNGILLIPLVLIRWVWTEELNYSLTCAVTVKRLFVFSGELCVEALCKMEISNSFQVFDKYQGIYLLLVHPNEMVRCSDEAFYKSAKSAAHCSTSFPVFPGETMGYSRCQVAGKGGSRWLLWPAGHIHQHVSRNSARSLPELWHRHHLWSQE